MKIVSIAINNHDTSFSVFEDGKILKHILSERISRIKKDYKVNSIIKSNLLEDNVDMISAEVFVEDDVLSVELDQLISYLTTKNNSFLFKNFEQNSSNHHISHANVGIHSSNFDECLCFVLDGNGSLFNINGQDCFEIESVFLVKNRKIVDTIYKKYFKINYHKKYNFDESIKNINYININNFESITTQPSIGILYDLLAEKIGFDPDTAGKIMGLSQYKKFKEKLPEEYNDNNWKNRVDECYNLQQYTQDKICNLIEKYTKKTGIKNVILTGGVFLNCVSNYYCVKKFPEINFHVDPFCSDKSISIGNCLNLYSQKQNKIPDKISNTYLGHKETKYDLEEKYNRIENFYHEKKSYKDIIDLITAGNIVCLFQGKSETGERSLGNRSILFDPRVKNGNEIVNRVKKRETYRPFAATILLEKSNEWFNMETIKESPFMSYAIDVKNNLSHLIPAVVHADNTCRIQTVTQNQNFHFYNIISEFHKKTNIPMLLNTSFNLSGDPIVETFDDAIYTLKNSELEYLYLPEIQTLVTIKN